MVLLPKLKVGLVGAGYASVGAFVLLSTDVDCPLRAPTSLNTAGLAGISVTTSPVA